MGVGLGRRGFLKVLGAGLAAGAVAGALGEHFLAPAEVVATTTTATSAVPPEVYFAGFGWEVVNLHNNGADLFIQVLRDIILRWIDLDASYMLTRPVGPGFAEVLITVGISSITPSFSSPPQVYQQLPQSTTFSPVTIVNPNNLQTVADAYPEEGFLTRLILKSWVPENGTASSVQRHVTLYPMVKIKAGSYIVFHMDHAGVGPLDCEIQTTLGYSLV